MPSPLPLAVSLAKRGSLLDEYFGQEQRDARTLARAAIGALAELSPGQAANGATSVGCGRPHSTLTECARAAS
jgi:hypothetical protein